MTGKLTVLSAAKSNKTKHDDISLNRQLELNRHGVPLLVVGHHMAHAVGAFATSGFADAAVLVVDGAGSPWADLTPAERMAVNARFVAGDTRHPGVSRETHSIYMGMGTALQPVEKQMTSLALPRKPGMRPFRSLGIMYGSVAMQLFGGRGSENAGKLMGLAPYGMPDTPTRDFFEIEDGHFEFLDTISNRYLHEDRWPMRQDEYQNLAASTQRALEDALFVLVLRLRQLTKAKRLCYAGGVALNSVANEMIIGNAGVDDVFIMPAAEDSGTAIGAAYCGLWQLTGHNTCRRQSHDETGRHYDQAEIAATVRQCPAVSAVQSANVVEDTAALLADGKIVGWFQGGSELGPRALGQRSILCDPRRADMKDILNSTVKFREAFRPFAPVIPFENLAEWFQPAQVVETPFMLRVMSFREDVRERVPAVVHIDGTGRVQTVTRDANGRFYELVKAFHLRTGVPIILNTSFNVAGEPIVETPDDALSCLLLTGLDSCVLDEWIVSKLPACRSCLDLVPRLAIDRTAFDYCLAAGWNVEQAQWTGEVKRLWSGHLDRLPEMEHMIACSRGHLVRVVTRTCWGPIAHVMNMEAMSVLMRIDGRRNGWQILKLLNDENQASISERTMMRTLAMLKRLLIIEWKGVLGSTKSDAEHAMDMMSFDVRE